MGRARFSTYRQATDINSHKSFMQVSRSESFPAYPTRTEYLRMSTTPPSSDRNDDNFSNVKNTLHSYRALEFIISLLALAISAVIYSSDVHERKWLLVLNCVSNLLLGQVLYRQSKYALIPPKLFTHLIPILIKKSLSNIVRDLIHLSQHAHDVSKVTMSSLLAIGMLGPVFVHLVIIWIQPFCKSEHRTVPHDSRDFLLSALQSIAMSVFFTQFLKNATGRFRPCFHDMCQWDYSVVWDGVKNLCTAPKWDKEGRKSFPSGHSSFAWSTLFHLTLYLLGRSRLVAEDRHVGIYRGGTKLFSLFVCFIPTVLAAWIALTRTLDNWHHYSDIIVGSLIGAGSAVLAYAYNYGSVFHHRSAGLPIQAYHRMRKVQKEEGKARIMEEMRSWMVGNEGAELTGGGEVLHCVRVQP